MQAEARKIRISAILEEREYVSLEDLAREIGASPSTIRRDLIDLEKDGVLKRTHGGARNMQQEAQDEYAFRVRQSRRLKEKQLIAARAAKLVTPQSCIILDTGTTVYEVARCLEDKIPQMLTNSLPVANLYGSSAAVEVIVSGGVLYPRLGALVGPLAERFFGEVNASLAIMGGDGLTPEGIFNSHTLLIDIQRKMMQAADQVVFCLDGSKLGRRSMSRLCPPEEIDLVITDRSADEKVVAELRAAGIQIEVVG